MTQLIAHDKEVYDIAFARGPEIFASVGADGSVRLFDLRSVVARMVPCGCSKTNCWLLQESRAQHHHLREPGPHPATALVLE